MAGIQKRLGFTLGSLLMAGCLVVACQGGSEEGPDHAQAGASQGGAPTNEGPCDLGGLQNVCTGKDCPDSPEDVTPVCSAFGTTRYATECGTMINLTRGLGSTSYFFDEDDKLIGITNTNDLFRDCGDGHESNSTVAGTTCMVTGEGENLCDMAGSCDMEDVCDRSANAFIECPANLASFVPHCDDGFYTRKRGNACGGAIIEVGDGVRTQRFTFGRNGLLLGTTRSGDVGDEACWGDPCEPRGTLQDLCINVRGAGGEGGSGASGGGGAGSAP